MTAARRLANIPAPPHAPAPLTPGQRAALET